jgi:hypothetical protein
MTTPTRTPTSNPPSPAPERELECSRPRRRDHRIALAAVIAASVVVLAAIAVWMMWLRSTPRDPVIRFTQPIPADVETEARAAVADFVDVFAARRDCMGTAEVVLVDEVDGGDARYVDVDGVIEIEIPTTPERFRESLVHELAHHVERTCPDFAVLRGTWAEQTGIDWSGQDRWEDRPSEQWAEVVVEMVLGERMLHGDEMPIDADLVVLAVDWIEG